MNATARAALLLTSITIAACGGSVQDNSRLTDAGAGGGSSSSTTTSGSGATGGGDACAAYADQAGAASVTLHFENHDYVPIYLSLNCGQLDYDLVPDAGPDGVSYAYSGGCLQTCDNLQTSPPVACGACPEQVLLLPPGGSHDVVWDGTGLKSAQMPASCYAQPSGTTECLQKIAAPSGTYRVQSTAYPACEGGCSCDAQGFCEGSQAGPQGFATPTSFAFPEQADVDVIYQPCTFGCVAGG